MFLPDQHIAVGLFKARECLHQKAHVSCMGYVSIEKTKRYIYASQVLVLRCAIFRPIYLKFKTTLVFFDCKRLYD
jgi:hypothetical protein